MNPIRSAVLFIGLCVITFAPPVFAQAVDNTQTNDRISHLEHDLMLLQRQVSKDGSPPPSSTTPSGNATDSDVPAGGSAQLEVRLSAIEDQLRELRGKVEETDNRSRKLSDSFDKLQKDVDFRFNEMPQAGAPKPLAATNAATAVPSLGTATGNGAVKPLLLDNGVPPTPLAKTQDTGKDDTSSFSSPRELYNYAFRLLNQTQYEEAATAFDSFTKKYPKDPLVGNAFYWEGETYYIRRDYVNSADFFRQGFEAMPEGPKAADNLLKLAMSLDALSRDKEACLVLQQIISKYKKTASSAADKAEAEEKRIACHKG